MTGRDSEDPGYLSRDPGYLCPLLPWTPAPAQAPAHAAILGSLQPIKPELLRDASDLASSKAGVKTEAGPDISLAPGSSGGHRLARLPDTHLPQLPSLATKSSELYCELRDF